MKLGGHKIMDNVWQFVMPEKVADTEESRANALRPAEGQLCVKSGNVVISDEPFLEIEPFSHLASRGFTTASRQTVDYPWTVHFVIRCALQDVKTTADYYSRFWKGWRSHFGQGMRNEFLTRRPGFQSRGGIIYEPWNDSMIPEFLLWLEEAHPDVRQLLQVSQAPQWSAHLLSAGF